MVIMLEVGSNVAYIPLEYLRTFHNLYLVDSDSNRNLFLRPCEDFTIFSLQA